MLAVVGEQSVGAANASAANGRVLRVASAEEIRHARNSARLPESWLNTAQERVAAAATEVLLIDAERLADGVHVIVYLLGEPTAELGPVAVALSDAKTRVRFERWESAAGEPHQPLPPQETAIAEISKRERWKLESNSSLLREVLADREPLTQRTARMLEIHGIYRQRKSAVEQKRMMLRIRSPLGQFSVRQLGGLLDLVQSFQGSVRLTDRQGIQLHDVPLDRVGEVQHRLKELWLSTFSACGDGVRSIVTCPVPRRRGTPQFVAHQLARELTKLLVPDRRQHDALLDSRDAADESIEDPLFGPQLLPHKLKVGLAAIGENCFDLLSNDIAILVGEQGTACWTIGGWRTEPRLDEIGGGEMPVSAVPQVVQEILRWYRDAGNRSDRRRGRLRHAVMDQSAASLNDHVRRSVAGACGLLGVDRFLPRTRADHLGWTQQDDGRWALGIHVLSGRLEAASAVSRWLRAETADYSLRVTPQQNLLLVNVPPDGREALDRQLQASGVMAAEPLSIWRRGAVSCPALPTCSLAVGEAERIVPSWLDSLESEHDVESGPRNESQSAALSWAVAGCENGCSRPWSRDVGVIARDSSTFEVWVGGGDGETAFLWRDSLTESQVVSALSALYNQYLKRSRDGESLSAYCHRIGAAALRRDCK